MTPDHQGRGRKAIKGATAAAGYESKPLELPTFPPADAKSCTSCANFNFCGISFQAASTAHNVHEVNGCPGKRHPVLPESLAKLFCLAFQFFQLFLVLWRKYSIQEVKRRGTGSEVHLAKSVRNDGVFSNSQWLCVLVAPSRGAAPSVGKMQLLLPKRGHQRTVRTVFYIPKPPEQPAKSQWVHLLILRSRKSKFSPLKSKRAFPNVILCRRCSDHMELCGKLRTLLKQVLSYSFCQGKKGIKEDFSIPLHIKEEFLEL